VKTESGLEIMTQVAAGLAAIHEQNLVHRDIKPSNIMVRLKDDGVITAKIIDLGLAKSLDEPGAQTAISTPGAFAGTPEFASPEQFAGIGADIRSDLYSLGIMLWEMVAGKTPFRSTPGEVMYQHQHSPLPLQELEGVPQPVVTLLEVLLEKDPGRRFQNPGELLKAIPTVTERIDAGRRITAEGLHKMPPAASRTVTRKPPVRQGPKKISVAKLPVTGSDLFGREEDIAFLDDAWPNKDASVVTIVAWAGVGKSTLVNHWLRRMAADHYRSAELVFGWSFYRQGTSEDSCSADEFLDAALAWFGDPDPRIGTAWEKGERLAKLIAHRRALLVLDGLEPLQNPPGPQEGRLREPSLQALLHELAAFNRGLCAITTRLPVADIADHERTSALRRELEQLSADAGGQAAPSAGRQWTFPRAECDASFDYLNCAITAVLPESIPMVNTTVTGLVRPVKSTPLPSASNVKMLLPSGTICAFNFTSLMTPLKSNLPLGFCSKEPAGIVTEKVPICRVTSSVTGLIPLEWAPSVKDSFRSKPFLLISSFAKDAAKGTSGVIAKVDPDPAAKGEPGTGVRAPLEPIL
jgi:serine/threonine protein kinase